MVTQNICRCSIKNLITGCLGVTATWIFIVDTIVRGNDALISKLKILVVQIGRTLRNNIGILRLKGEIHPMGRRIDGAITIHTVKISLD